MNPSWSKFTCRQLIRFQLPLTAERIWFHHVLGGVPKSECDGGTTAGDASFVVGENETLAGVVAEFERVSERSRAIAAEFKTSMRSERTPHLGEVNLRFIF